MKPLGKIFIDIGHEQGRKTSKRAGQGLVRESEEENHPLLSGGRPRRVSGQNAKGTYRVRQ